MQENKSNSGKEVAASQNLKDGMLPAALEKLVFGNASDHLSCEKSKAQTYGSASKTSNVAPSHPKPGSTTRMDFSNDNQDVMLHPALEKLVFGCEQVQSHDISRQEEKSVKEPSAGVFPMPRKDDGIKKKNTSLLMKLPPELEGYVNSTIDSSDRLSSSNVEESDATIRKIIQQSDSAQMMPRLSRNPDVQSHQQAQPGAYSIAGLGHANGQEGASGSTNNDALTAAAAGSEHPDQPALRNNTIIEDEELAIANPVMEDSQLRQLPNADEVSSVESSQGDSSLGKRRLKNHSWLAFLLLVLGAIPTLIVWHVRNQEESQVIDSVDLPSNDATTGNYKTKEHFFSLLPEATVMAIRNNSFAQAKAFDWLFNDPAVEEYPDWRLIQRWVLATFYYSTNGENWFNNTRWLSYNETEHECTWASRHWYEWQSLETYYRGSRLAPRCVDGVFHHLWLFSNQLGGTIPDELFLLPSLKSFSMFANEELAGTIPAAIAKLSNLEAFCLTKTGLSGALPSQIGLLTKLSAISIANSRFSGGLPSEFGQLTRLERLLMDQTLLSSTIPTEIGRLTNLTHLTLDGSHIYGPLPSQIGRMTTLHQLWLEGTEVSGTLPKEISSLATTNGGNLEDLSIENTLISGTVPESFCSLVKPIINFTCSASGNSHNLCGCNCSCDQ